MAVQYIDQTDISNKKVLLRVDFNVTLTKDFQIADDYRIKQSLETIEHLLRRNNTIILVSHLDRPEKRDPKYSLKPVVERLKEYLPNTNIELINDFLTEKNKIKHQKEPTIYVLENIRFYKGESNNDPGFSKKLAELADVYVNDAFGVSHRVNASTVGVTEYLPSYGGLLLKKEIETINKYVFTEKHKPFTAILGGAKISTKIMLIDKLLEISDYLLIGGGIANTFLSAQGLKIGKSLYEYDFVETARKILFKSAKTRTAIILPEDVVLGFPDDSKTAGEVVKIEQIKPTETRSILDIGPETKAKFGSIIMQSKTIVWNGPVGYIENPNYRQGTDFIYYSICENTPAVTIVGGGDTLAAISKKEYLDKIDHISTGGGAMLEFIEKGSLPGISALGF
ncbi:MAG: phosphoglycerate kinase [Patescibacteria group bacterium]|nr:MAG: phosphoglycerate kinase [Patescibacteria group bacterium]